MNSQAVTLSVIFSVAIAFVLMVNGQVGQAPQAPQAPQVQQAPQAQQVQQAPQAPQASQDEASNTLPAGAELIIGELKPGFTCDSKVYGYYADINNECRVFHVCWPITDEHGATLNKQWTFVCGNQTLFNQERLVCDRPENVNCAQSESFYSVNNEFGKIPGAQ